MRAAPLLASLLLAAAGCGLDGLNVVPEPEPDAGTLAPPRPDPGGPEPGPIDRCLRDVNTAYVEGEAGGRVYSGTALLEGGRWDAGASPPDAPYTVKISQVTSTSGEAPDWRFEFSVAQLRELLRPFTFDDAAKMPGVEGRPAMNVTAGGRGCAGIVGRFRVHQIAAKGAKLTAFTASFEQRCSNETAWLRGCVRFSDPF